MTVDASCRLLLLFLSGSSQRPASHTWFKKPLFTKQSAFNVAGNLVIVVKFTFQIVFGNSRQNPRHASARGHDESLELHSIL